ncbi:MAG: adenylate/guanylate cyclase domain-containing protein [Bacteroidales bacterium]
MLPRIIKFILFLFCVQSLTSFGSENKPYIFRIDSLNKTVELNRYWRYHAGDNPAWADPTFDDSEWDTLSTRLNLAELEEGVFGGFGWFRLHLVIDSSLRNRSFALLIDQQGASEIYLNGMLLDSIGTLGADGREERASNPKNIPTLISFNDSIKYVLAVRYSNLDAYSRLKNYREANAGFRINIRDHKFAMQSILGEVYGTYLVLVLFSVFLVLGLVHFLLFIFYRKQKSNLYYSIFMILFSGLTYVVFLTNGITENPPFVDKASFIMSIGFPLFFVPLAGMIYNLFMVKMPRIFWFTIGLAGILSLMYYLDVGIIGFLYIGFVLLLWFEVTRVVIRAMIKKTDGAWIIGIGVLFFILFFTVIMVYIIRYGNITLSDQSVSTLIFGLLTISAILSIPFSMSVYLARDFARTNINLEKQLEQVKILSAKTLEQEREKKHILEGQKEKLEILVTERTKELAAEKEKTEELLLNTLPLKVVNELKQNGKSEPESFEDVTVYFSDIVGFTSISSKLDPKVLIGELNEIFTGFDDIMEKHECERIKTIGDAYLAVSGMPERNKNHAENMVNAAMEIRQFLAERNKSSNINWQVRIGIHTGKVVGGIVGVKKYIYDVFGDAINTTSRMESNSEPNQINVSETTYLLLKGKFKFFARKPMEIKGKGEMRMYFLEG